MNQSLFSSKRSAYSPRRLAKTLLCGLLEQHPLRSSSGSSRTTSMDDKSTLPEVIVPTLRQASSKDSALDRDYEVFLSAYPEYKDTCSIDVLRQTEFARLAQTGETYLDYMGGALYPERLLWTHVDFLARNVMGNTHSVSNSSAVSTRHAAEAREEVLRFFDAPPGYTVIFTANASTALKLVGESFPFREGGSLVLPADCHNSVNGMRQFAARAGAGVHYLRSTEHGGINEGEARSVLEQNKPTGSQSPMCLYAITGLSNISNSKTPLSMARFAKDLGYFTVLDAAALATSTRMSLKGTPVDAMAISFYKMFGYPTGIGALVVSENFLQHLQRPWFAGGTVDVVQVPGSLVTMAEDLREQFEDGTINYLGLPAITSGLRFLSQYLPLLPVRLSALCNFLASELRGLQHDLNGAPVVRILSRPPSARAVKPGEVADIGASFSLLFLDPDSNMIPNSFVEYAAAHQHISIRTGCVCNPGGAAAILGIENHMSLLEPGVSLKQFEERVGRELGVVRVSLGLVTDFADVWRFIQFANAMGNSRARSELWEGWKRSGGAARSTNDDRSCHVITDHRRSPELKS